MLNNESHIFSKGNRYVIIVTVSNWLFTDFLLLLHSEGTSYAASLSRKLSQAGRLARLILHITLLMSTYPLLHSSGNAALRIQVIQKPFWWGAALETLMDSVNFCLLASMILRKSTTAIFTDTIFKIIYLYFLLFFFCCCVGPIWRKWRHSRTQSVSKTRWL